VRGERKIGGNGEGQSEGWEGEVEGWRDGGMEGWRDEGMEGWRDGKKGRRNAGRELRGSGCSGGEGIKKKSGVTLEASRMRIVKEEDLEVGWKEAKKEVQGP
jgi:hypothetical protein